MAILKTVKTLKESKEYLQIKNDLMNQLQYKNAYTPTFISQINSYMSMWVSQSLLNMDIEERGTYVTYSNGGGQEGTRKNDSVAESIKVNAQMLKLLDALDIKSTTLRSNTNEEI